VRCFRLLRMLAHDQEPFTLHNHVLDLRDFVPWGNEELCPVCTNSFVLLTRKRHLLDTAVVAALAQEVDLFVRPGLDDLLHPLVDRAKHGLVAR